MGGFRSRRVIGAERDLKDAIINDPDQAAPRWGQSDGRVKGSTARKVNAAKRECKPAKRDGYLEQAKKLAALGATDAEMADSFVCHIRSGCTVARLLEG